METNSESNNNYHSFNNLDEDTQLNGILDEFGGIKLAHSLDSKNSNSNINLPSSHIQTNHIQPNHIQPSLIQPSNNIIINNAQNQSLISPNPINPVVKKEIPINPIPMNTGLTSSYSKIPFTLQNVVSTVNLSCKLELKSIALKSRNAEYNPKRFAAVIMKINDPKATALIFGSGKMVCTGTKSELQSKTAAKKFARIISKVGFENVKFKEFKIQNIVASSSVGFPIRLEGLQTAHKNFSHYEPEIFPGLVYRMFDPKVVLLIFVTGKVVFTGAKTIDDIKRSLDNIYPVLQEFRK